MQHEEEYIIKVDCPLTLSGREMNPLGCADTVL